MKTYHTLTLLVLMLLNMPWCYGQSGDQEFPSTNTNTSLICYCEQQNASIVYERTFTNIGYLYYVIHGDTFSWRVEVPMDIEFNDMECLGDTIYFGGRDVMNNLGVVGFFDVNKLFFRGGEYNYCQIQPTGTGWNSSITSVSKIEVYDGGMGDLHVGFIGDMSIYSQSWGSTVGEVLYDRNQNAWDVEYFYNKDNRAIYTDIAFTQRFVVATGRINESQCYFLQGWKRTPHFLSGSLFPNTIFTSTDEVRSKTVYISHVQNDEFVVSYTYLDGINNGIKIIHHKLNTTDGFGYIDGMKIRTLDINNYDIMDVVYHKSSNQVLVAYSWSNTIPNNVGFFNLAALHPTYIRVTHGNVRINSIDTLHSWEYQISGYYDDLSSSHILHYQYDVTSSSNPCFQKTSYTNDHHQIDLKKLPTSEYTIIPPHNPDRYFPSSIQVYNQINCQTY